MIRLREDIRYSVRVLLRSPGFSAAVVIALGLAIGATTSVFTVVNAVLLKSLPFRDPSRLVMVFEEIPGANSGPISFSAPDFRAFQERARSFDGLAAYVTKTYELSGIDQPERVAALRASAALFDVLGAAPVLGRAFTREEDEGRIPVVVLSDGLWRRSFGADPSVIGRAVMIDRRAYTVVGVMPRTFVFPSKGPLRNNEPADLFVPISFTSAELNGFASMYNNSVVGRLKPDVTLQQADADTRAVVGRLVNEVYPAPLRDGGFRLAGSVSPLRTETVGRVERLLEILFVAVMIVLLIACADVASLMLTRAVARSREVAVRSALGAGRAQLARQVLTEAALLSIAGGVLGVLIAYASTETIARVAPPTIPRLDELALDWRVMTFAIVISMLTALACGCLPALELSRRPSADALKDGGRSGTAGRRQKRLFGALVAAQFALAVGTPRCRWPADSQLQPADGGRPWLSIRARDHARHEPAGARVSRRAVNPGVLSTAARAGRVAAGRQGICGVDRPAALDSRAPSVHDRESAAGVRVRPESDRARLGRRAVLRGAGDHAPTGTLPLQGGHGTIRAGRGHQ